MLLYTGTGGKCRTLQVGNSPYSLPTKTVNINDRYRCPSKVDRHNLVDGFDFPVHGLKFSVKQEPGRVVVTRTDEVEEKGIGWPHLNLRFQCCLSAATGKSLCFCSKIISYIYQSLPAILCQ